MDKYSRDIFSSPQMILTNDPNTNCLVTNNCTDNNFTPRLFANFPRVFVLLTLLKVSILQFATTDKIQNRTWHQTALLLQWLEERQASTFPEVQLHCHLSFLSVLDWVVILTTFCCCSVFVCLFELYNFCVSFQDSTQFFFIQLVYIHCFSWIQWLTKTFPDMILSFGKMRIHEIAQFLTFDSFSKNSTTFLSAFWLLVSLNIANCWPFSTRWELHMHIVPGIRNIQ